MRQLPRRIKAMWRQFGPVSSSFGGLRARRVGLLMEFPSGQAKEAYVGYAPSQRSFVAWIRGLQRKRPTF